jgi:type III secretion protein W
MPDIRADGVGLRDQTAAQPRGEDGARTSGSYKGTEVQVINQQSLVADALEELTSELSEETEKDVSAREVEDGKKSDSLERLIKVQAVNELLQGLGDLDKRDLFRGLKALMQQKGASADQFRLKAKQQFDEPAHQYALLKSFAEALKERGAPDSEIAEVQQAIDDLMEDNGSSVRAALNIAEATNEFAADALGDHQTLRDTYRSNIHDYQNMVAVVDDLVERFGEEDLVKSISFMTQALGADLAAGGTSIDRVKLNLIMSDMHRLESLATIHGNCGIVMSKAHGQGANPNFTATSLLRELIPLQDSKWVQSGEIRAIPEHAGLVKIEPTINFLNDLKDVIRMIPLDSYNREENRAKLTDASQQALDETIAIEDAEEDA